MPIIEWSTLNPDTELTRIADKIDDDWFPKATKDISAHEVSQWSRHWLAQRYLRSEEGMKAMQKCILNELNKE